MPTQFRFLTDRLSLLRSHGKSDEPAAAAVSGGSPALGAFPVPSAAGRSSAAVAEAEPGPARNVTLDPRLIPGYTAPEMGATPAVTSAQPLQPPTTANAPVSDNQLTEELSREDGGLHSVLRSTDYWFNLELSLLEKNALTSAGLHAQAGLPRQDAPVREELPAEAVLRSRATELYLEWSERVKRKVQDGIQASSVTANESLLGLHHAFDRLEVVGRDVASVEEELQARRRENAGKDRSFTYGSLLGRKLYLCLLALLVLVDWVANVPVFQQLLPQEPGSEKAWLDMVDNAGRYGLWAGLYRAGAHILFSPEVSLLALGVVALLMFLGHVTGSSLRRIVAFRPKDETTVVFGLRSHRRQAWVPFAAGLLGAALVLGFLYGSRSRLVEVTHARQIKAQQDVDAVQAKLDAATKSGALDQISTLAQKRTDAQDLLDVRTESESYAESINGMNPAIFLLNLTLVIVAAAGAYLESHATVDEARLDDPGLARLEARMQASREEAVALRQTIRQLYGTIQSAIARARYLAGCFPLRDQEAKARRLEAVIPLFRTENARQRGVDVHNILAFQQPPALGLPVLPEVRFDVPVEIDVCEQNFSHLRTQMSAFGIQR